MGRNRTLRRVAALLVLGVLALPVVGTTGAGADHPADANLLDQETGGHRSDGVACPHPGSLFQSVVPPAPPHRLTAVRLVLRTSVDVPVTESTIRIHQGSPTGPVISIGYVTLPAIDDLRFVEADHVLVPPVSLPAGELAYVEWTPIPGYDWVLAVDLARDEPDDLIDPYPAGAAYTTCTPNGSVSQDFSASGYAFPVDFDVTTFRSALRSDPLLEQEHLPSGATPACSSSYAGSNFQSVIPPPPPYRLAKVTLRVQPGTAGLGDLQRVSVRRGSPVGPVIATGSYRHQTFPVSGPVDAVFVLVPVSGQSQTFAPGELAFVEFFVTGNPANSWRWVASNGGDHPYAVGQAYGCAPGAPALAGQDFAFVTHRALLPANLSVDTFVDTPTVRAGQSLRQSIRITNSGETSANNQFVFTSALIGFRATSIQLVEGGSCNLSQVSCTVTIPAGATRTVQIVWAVAFPTRGTLTATVGSVSDAVEVEVINAADDLDGDGLPDSWEMPGGGPDGDGDGDPDFFPYDFGARHNRKDLFVELDWLECRTAGCTSVDSRRFRQATVDRITPVFAAAPVSNPAGGAPGINLHMHIDPVGTPAPGDAPSYSDSPPDTPAVTDTRVDSLDDIKFGAEAGALPCDGAFGSAQDRSNPATCAAILRAKAMVYRWGISVGRLGGIDAFQLGVGGVWASTFAIALEAIETDRIERNAGDIATVEALDVLHELGHNLSFGHGGNDSISCKPNYQSVMNATYLWRPFTGANLLDYSSERLATIDERELPDNLNLGGSRVWPVVHFADDVQVFPLRLPGMAQDWNGNGLNDGSAPLEPDEDVNFWINPTRTGEAALFCGPRSPGQVLVGHDDWDNVAYAFPGSWHAPGYLPGPPADETDVLDPAAADAAPSVQVSVVPQTIVPGIGQIATVQIRTTPSFDATTVVPGSVCFGEMHDGAERDCTEVHSTGHLRDVDLDGDLDLELHYEVDQSGVDATDREACLGGTTTSGTPFVGCAPVNPPPPTPTSSTCLSLTLNLLGIRLSLRLGC